MTKLEEARHRIIVCILDLAPIRKPTHGTCCTCQICGHSHDECRCEVDEIVDALILEAKREAFEEAATLLDIAQQEMHSRVAASLVRSLAQKEKR